MTPMNQSTRVSVSLTAENQAALNQFRSQALNVGHKFSESAAINEVLAVGFHFISPVTVGEHKVTP